MSTTDQLPNVFTKSLQPKQQAACIARLLSHSYGTSVLTRVNLILSASCQSPRRPLDRVFLSRRNSSLECSTDLLTLASESTGGHEWVVIGSLGSSESWPYSARYIETVLRQSKNISYIVTFFRDKVFYVLFYIL